jgi:small subunit ribosomal protein S2
LTRGGIRRINMATKKAKKFEVSLEDLLEAGSHFGHQVRRWNPRMKNFIWAAKDGVHIFDLAKTAEQVNKAWDFLYKSASEGKKILLVGTKRQAADIVREEAKKAGVFFVAERWLGGTITNWGQIKSRVDKLVDMKTKRDAGEFKKYTKKEQGEMDKEIVRLERFFGGLVGMGGLPEVLFVVDTHKERIAVREAKLKGITVVGIVDTNADPTLVDIAIPANDDAIRSIKLIMEVVGSALAKGVKNYESKTKKK